MNLNEQRGLRLATHGVLVLIGLVLLAVGLALLSGMAQSGAGGPTTALVIVQPVRDGSGWDSGGRPAARSAEPPGGRTHRPAYDGSEAPPGGPPRALPPPPPRGRPLPRDGEARLAIVIDDIGHNVEAAQRFLALGYPLTFSVLPDVPYARESAAEIRRAGREYIIHLPMEPFDYPRQDPGPYPLLLAQGMQETARRVRDYLADLPEAIGASNHMGSAYTYDVDHMQVVQTVLAERNLFFLNSRTSSTPVPEQVARQWGYAYLERDVFLDHDLSEAAIEAAFQAAVRNAQRAGQAIAIGHPHPQTWRVLHRNLPRLERRGVRAVPLSQLLGR